MQIAWTQELHFPRTYSQVVKSIYLLQGEKFSYVGLHHEMEDTTQVRNGKRAEMEN